MNQDHPQHSFTHSFINENSNGNFNTEEFSTSQGYTMNMDASHENVFEADQATTPINNDLPLNDHISHHQDMNGEDYTHITPGISNINMNITCIDTTLPAPQHSFNYNYNGPNITYECYLLLPNDTRIYYVTYAELHPFEIVRALNNGIDLSHIPDYQLQHHYNLQSSIQQHIQQQTQQSQPHQQSNH